MRRSALLILPALLVLIVGCGDDDATTTPSPTPAPTGAPATPPAAPTPQATPPSTHTTTGPDPVTAESLEALFDSLDAAPRDARPVRERNLPQPPPSPYPEHDQRSTVLYDTHTGEVFDFGPGDWGHFSPDGRYMAWISRADSDGELRVLDLETREQRDLGEAGFISAGFIDAHTVVVDPRSGRSELVDVRAGDREAFPTDMMEPGRVLARQGSFGVTLREEYALIDLPSGDELVRFSATRATFAGPGELLLVTPWTGESANLHLVDLEAIEATFIATIALDEVPVLPLGGSSEVIAWTENYCNWPGPQGVTWYLDRAAGELVRFDRGVWVTVTPDGRLGYGEFGPHVLLDRETLEFEVVLPEGTIDVNWSPDFRYASRGMAYGHGGYCPP